MTASEDASARLDLLMHAQGHAFQATDDARLAQRELADGGTAGLATLARAVAQLADALAGVIDATAQGISDEHGLGYGRARDASDPGITH